MKKKDSIPETLEFPNTPAAEAIAELGDNGEDISRFFTGKGKMMPPIAEIEEDTLSDDPR